MDKIDMATRARSGVYFIVLVSFIFSVLVPGGTAHAEAKMHQLIPPSWRVLPVPRYADYGASDQFLTLSRTAIVRRAGGPYHTVRDERSELVGDSTITEEELTRILNDHGAISVESVADDLPSYAKYDTLILLGPPRHNRQTKKYYDRLGLSFDRWDDPNTPEDDFTGWQDFGREGYLLKVAPCESKTIAILAGHDSDDRKGRFFGAGTFYAIQSFRQLLVKEAGALKVKTTEIADKPLLAARGCMTGFGSSVEQQWLDIAFLPEIKANQNVYWYGNALGGYNSEAASKFRYPWKPEQLELYSKFGKYCRERYVTMVFCVNPDHYNVDWAAAKTFDGGKKDPLHYDPNHEVEPQFKEMWAKLGYEVRNDVDILAAKFGQLQQVIPGAMFQIMNEDDVFGLVHAADKKLFRTDTSDDKTNKKNYGRARAQLLARLYRTIKERHPNSPDFMPICPPDGLCYQLVLDRDEQHSREFLSAMGNTLKKLGVLQYMPFITTGGGTAAEVITCETIDNFKQWAAGAPVALNENNFAGFHIGAYETDPTGPRSPHQLNKRYPAGYRDKDLYKRLWGAVWNGVPEHHVLGWCQAQFAWNMLALDRNKINALAARKVSSAASYPLVKSYLEEFDNPACYLPDNQPPYRLKAVTDRIVFPADGWTYLMNYTGAMRKECQRLHDKFAALIPELETKWENESERRASLDELGYSAYSFCSIYLAYGYIRGWENDSGEGRLTGDRLRDLFLEAEDFQQLFFFGPETVGGKKLVNRHYYRSPLSCLYMGGKPFSVPKAPSEAEEYIDIWKEGLVGKFFDAVSSLGLAQAADTDPRLTRGWGEIQERDGQKFRTVKSEAVLNIAGEVKNGRLLIRAKIGTSATSLGDSTQVRLSTAGALYELPVCKPRWINWHLPVGLTISDLKISVEKPVRVYAIEIFRGKV